eukprot:TRINITY_DN83086_c0_g1_i1.p1 TRINITY_DN83086_c0_g1~~TRINITY_DN83086_c0_g1_i1.p1  ORF type:complete len:343 (+),score=61.72 TRINITY_DN83086_c0_g1_i1:100-1128(+)
MIVPRGLTSSRSCFLACLLACGCNALMAPTEPSPGFLIVTAPRNGKISWVRLPEGTHYEKGKFRTLIDEGLQHPQGVAVDQKRKRLYVADPDVRSIFSYQLIYDGDELRTTGTKTVVTNQVESRWVTVDSLGAVFFSDEPRNLILKMSPDRVLRGDHEPEVVYDGLTNTAVNAPGGVSVDNFHLFWTNKHQGMEAGTVIRGFESGGGSTSGPKPLHVLARSSEKSYGICSALGNLFYTDASRKLYGVKKSGGKPVEVSGSLKSPRGCTWDGSGTVYVADRSANAIYAFAGDMGDKIEPAQLTKAFHAEDAFGVAVAVDVSGAAQIRASAALLLLLAALGLHR